MALRATLTVEVRGGTVGRLACEPPLSAKIRTDGSGWTDLWLVASGASVLEGDELAVALLLDDGARLRVRSVAAQLAHPCPSGGHGSFTVTARLRGASQLCWRPEPVIVAAGARYRSRTVIECDPTASVWWSDELVLGRTGEDPGAVDLDTTLRLDVDGIARWRDGLATAAGWDGAAVLGAARYVATRFAVGPAVSPVDDAGPTDDTGPTGPTHPSGPTDPSGRSGPAHLPCVPVEPGPDPDPFTGGPVPLAGGGWTWRTIATDPAAGRVANGRTDGRSAPDRSGTRTAPTTGALPARQTVIAH